MFSTGIDRQVTSNHGYEPQGKPRTLIPPQGAGYYTPLIRDNSTNKLLRSLGLITLRLWRDCSTYKFQYTSFLKFESHNKGFSIIEMLVVIILMAILATTAGSMFSNHVKNRNLKDAAACLMSDIKLAKQKSAAERTDISITINPDQNGYNFSGATKNFSTFGNGIVIKDNKFSSNTINFQSRGTCVPAGSIQLANSLGSSIKIIVSPMGRVRSVETYK